MQRNEITCQPDNKCFRWQCIKMAICLQRRCYSMHPAFLIGCDSLQTAAAHTCDRQLALSTPSKQGQHHIVASISLKQSADFGLPSYPVPTQRSLALYCAYGKGAVPPHFQCFLCLPGLRSSDGQGSCLFSLGSPSDCRKNVRQKATLILHTQDPQIKCQSPQ